MKSKILSVFALLTIFALVGGSLAFAEETGDDATSLNTSPSTKKTLWEKLKEKKDNFLQKRDEKRQEFEQKKENWEEKKEELLKKKEEKVENRCKAITLKINEKTKKFNENKEKHVKNYQNLKDRIQKSINKAEENGYDTSKLKEDLKILDGKIKKFAEDYASYIKELEDTRAFVCGQSEGQFKTALEEARAAMKKVHEDAKDIREFFRTTIRADIKALREQRKDKTE